MLYFSIAITVIVIVLAYKQPVITVNFNQHKTIEVVQPSNPPTESGESEDISKIRQDLEKEHRVPPTIDEVAAALNDVLFDLGGKND